MVASSRLTAPASPARSARTSAPLQKCLPSPRRTTIRAEASASSRSSAAINSASVSRSSALPLSGRFSVTVTAPRTVGDTISFGKVISLASFRCSFTNVLREQEKNTRHYKLSRLIPRRRGTIQQIKCREEVMRSIWFLAAALLSPLIAFDNANAGNGVVKIGILNDQSGVFADSTGTGSTDAARMAAEDFGGKVAGMPIEIIAADHQNRADVGAAIARKWFDLDGVDAIADLGNSAVALAVNEIAREKNRTILVSAGGTTTLTGSACSPNSVQWTYDTWSQSSAIGTALVKAGNLKWFFLTADYTFGYNLRDETSKVVLANGGENVDSVRHPN